MAPDVSLDYYNKGPITNNFVPFFVSTKSNINAELFERTEVVENQDFNTIKSGRDGLDTIPDGAISFKEVSMSKLNATIKINDLRDLDLHRNNGVTNLKESRQLKDS